MKKNEKQKYFMLLGTLDEVLFQALECYIDMLNNDINYVHGRSVYTCLVNCLEKYNEISESDTVVYLADGKYYLA